MNFDAAALSQLAEQQRVPVTTVVTAVEQALTDAYAKTRAAVDGARADIDMLAGTVTIVAPDGADVTPADFGRLAAAATRQAVVQWLRDVDRIRKVGRWAGTEGTVLRAVVRANPARNRRGETCFDLGADAGAEAVMPSGEAIDGESYTPGEELAVIVLAVNADDRAGVRLTVSRRQPALVSALFAQVTPELSSGSVVITSVARDPGSRTKVAARAQQGHDPVAALVGPGADRVKQVVSALDGEKVDVIRHSDDLAEFVAAALTPARVLSATVTDSTRRMITVLVAPDQLALALGRGGANSKLAQRLTGARIDITTPH